MKPSFLSNFARIAICALMTAVTASAQVAGQQRGVLLSPQRGTLLERNGSCTIGSLSLKFTTGSDDLRGDQNNLNVEVHYASGDIQTASNVNQGANWPNRSVKVVTIPLKHPVAPSEIKQIVLVHSTQAGFSGRGQSVGTVVATGGASLISGVKTEDNWDMAEVQVFGVEKGANVPVAYFGEHKFTGSDPALTINAQPGAACPTGNQISRIVFTFQTADDDLRGGNDNLNITILFTDGAAQLEPNVNHSLNWPNGSRSRAEILLNRPVTIDQIRGIVLADTFGSGFGGDIWKMASMQADAFLADGSHHTIAKAGFHRFSADTSGPSAREIEIRPQLIN